MSIRNTSVARVASAVAGLGLVLTGFAPLAQAQTSTTTTTTTVSTSVTFSRDLTIGSTGADVTLLQQWLISKGFGISAGATGYFGMQTKAALAAFQAANRIAPAAGYFGPLTRAAVNAMQSPTPGQDPNPAPDTTGTLKGGEATLRNFDLIGGNDLAEGDSNKEIAAAKFEVRGGDVRVQRVTVELTATGTGSLVPWKYLDTLAVYDGSKKVGSVDVSSKSDWDKSGNTYSIDIPVNTIVRERTRAELSIRATAVDTIDSANVGQSFTLRVPTNGIRAVDAKGIQQYAGNDSVTFGIDSMTNAKLSVRESSDNPEAQVLVAKADQTSDKYDVLSFEIRNREDADATINGLTFNVTSASTSASSIIRKATLTLDGDTYTGTVSGSTIVFDDMNLDVNGNDSVDGTLTIALFSQANRYAGTGESLTFSLPASGIDAENDRGDAISGSNLSGTVQGNEMTIATDAGINVANKTNSASVQTVNTTTGQQKGSFTLRFSITANGDDVYVPKAVATTDSASNASAGVIVDTDLNSDAPQDSPAIMTSSAQTNGNYYVVREGATETFTVTVSITPSTSGFYQVGLDKVRFTDAPAGALKTLEIDQNKSQFQTEPVDITAA